jgi:hypothetical protein
LTGYQSKQNYSRDKPTAKNPEVIRLVLHNYPDGCTVCMLPFGSVIVELPGVNGVIGI